MIAFHRFSTSTSQLDWISTSSSSISLLLRRFELRTFEEPLASTPHSLFLYFLTFRVIYTHFNPLSNHFPFLFHIYFRHSTWSRLIFMSWTMCCSLQIGLHLRRSTSLERFTYLDYPSLALSVSRAYAHYISLLYHRTALRYEYLGIYRHPMYVDRDKVPWQLPSDFIVRFVTQSRIVYRRPPVSPSSP